MQIFLQKRSGQIYEARNNGILQNPATPHLLEDSFAPSSLCFFEKENESKLFSVFALD